MPRTHTPPASIEIRTALARDALALYEQWQENTPIVLGRLASSLELLLEAIQEAGL